MSRVLVAEDDPATRESVSRALELEGYDVAAVGDGAAASLQRWAGQIEGRGACRFPDGAVRFLRSALDVFGDDLRRHAAGRPCRAAAGGPFLPIPPTKEAPWR